MWVDIFGGRNGVNHIIRTSKLGKRKNWSEFQQMWGNFSLVWSSTPPEDVGPEVAAPELVAAVLIFF